MNTPAAPPAPPSGSRRPPAHQRSRVRGIGVAVAAMAMITVGAALMSCRAEVSRPPAAEPAIKPFTFHIAVDKNDYQIEGYLALASTSGLLPALLILNGDKGNARQCIDSNRKFTAMGLQVACISLPGYGRSSGPSRFIGPPSVAAARRALDLLDARPDVDPDRLAVWGIGNGAVAAGLLMDSDARPRAVILQSGAYDMLKLWPEAPLRTKLSILRQVWPSKRVLKERSVIGNMPHELDVDVLILHGERDRKMPVDQAERLAQVLGQRGARVQTCYFPNGSHELGKAVDAPLRTFIHDKLLAPEPRDGSNASNSGG